MKIYFSVKNGKAALTLHHQLSSGPRGYRWSPMKPWAPWSSKMNWPARTIAKTLRVCLLEEEKNEKSRTPSQPIYYSFIVHNYFKNAF